MSDESTLTEQRSATGTWNVRGPINLFAFATYRINGKSVRLPIVTVGEHITGSARARVL